MSVDPRTPEGVSPSGLTLSTEDPLWRRFLGFPRARSGWWSVLFIVAFIILITLFLFVSESGSKGSPPFLWKPVLPGILVAACASGIGAAALGLFSLVWKRERSLLVFISVVLGLLIAAFTVGANWTDITRGGR